jgi:hypothetical protein
MAALLYAVDFNTQDSIYQICLVTKIPVWDIFRDRTIEAFYGRSFDDDSQRVAYLFELYNKVRILLLMAEDEVFV